MAVVSKVAALAAMSLFLLMPGCGGDYDDSSTGTLNLSATDAPIDIEFKPQDQAAFINAFGAPRQDLLSLKTAATLPF